MQCNPICKRKTIVNTHICKSGWICKYVFVHTYALMQRCMFGNKNPKLLTMVTLGLKEGMGIRKGRFLAFMLYTHVLFEFSKLFS